MLPRLHVQYLHDLVIIQFITVIYIVNNLNNTFVVACQNRKFCTDIVFFIYCMVKEILQNQSSEM